MKRILFAAVIVLGFVVQGWGQSFKEREIIYVGDKANDKYPIIYAQEKVDKYDVVFNLTGDTLSYRKRNIPDWKNGSVLDTIVLREKGYNKSFCRGIKSNIKPKDGRLHIYIWEMKDKKQDKKFNEFITDNQFSIKLEDNINFSVVTSSCQIGAMTMPLKVYLGRRNKDFTEGMVESDVNIGMYIGYKIGYKSFVKLKHEDEYRVYTKAFSINGIVGLSKLDISSKNVNTFNETFTGSVPALNIGVGLGVHYRDFALFTALGVDTPLNKYGKNWNYKGKPWLGIGVGYKIF